MKSKILNCYLAYNWGVKYNTPIEELCKQFGISRSTYNKYLKKVGLNYEV